MDKTSHTVSYDYSGLACIHRRTSIPIKLTDSVVELITFSGLCDGKEHFCMAFDVDNVDLPLVRIHS
jgi:hypothetical protein